MRSKRNYILLFAFYLLHFSCFAQEQEVPLTVNATIHEALSKNPGLLNARIASTPDTLHLPVVDDFSYEGIYPSADYWTDNYVFINRSFAYAPPTIGVATFDGLDQYGNVYSLTPTASGACDTLTSKPINLFDDGAGHNYALSDSINLSFYYERKGVGDAPESTDSLVLQYYNTDSSKWYSQWKITGGTDITFTWVKLDLTDATFLRNGFRFRFINFGSKAGAADHFHLDYIALRPYDVNPIVDNAFVYNSPPLLQNYSAMPWRHYVSLNISTQSNELPGSVDLKLINNNGSSVHNDSVLVRCYDQYGGLIITDSRPTALSPNVSTLCNYSLNTKRYIDTLADDSASFDMVNFLQNNNDVNPANDTIHYHQNFYDYYAYDDGSAESGYNVNGAGAMIAMKYTILKADTLRALQIFFEQIGAPATGQPFKIVVWNVAGGSPGTILYQQGIFFTPQYTNIINGFFNYKLNSFLTIPAGDIFVGIIQNNNFQMNFGLDKNTNTNPFKLYYNTTGSWVQSSINGSVMIRPVFGDTLVNVGLHDLISGENFSVYPVPVNDLLKIEVPSGLRKKMQLTLADMYGRVIIRRNEIPSDLEMNGVTNGVYLLSLTDQQSGERLTRKIIVNH